MAWTESGAVDPIHTILGLDGNDIADDQVNYFGGLPGDYYGTELDFQLQWLYRDLFAWTIEAAVLFPGSGMQDEHGNAVNSFFLENRFELLY
jgi:hypothetical protein